jgi:hypothetical protein
MKKIFLSAMIGSLVTLFACNDANNANDDTKSGDSTAAATESTPAPANSVVMKSVTLSADQEVPPTTSKGSGTADVSYDKDSKTLTFTVNYKDLTSAPNMAHIHGPAPRGVNAGVVHDLSGKLPKEASGSFSDTVKVDGNTIKEDSLLAGRYYFNIHTPKNPGGEIRGQIEF